MASLDFSRTAVRLSRNPLGIIALFIVLVYAMASMVMAQARFDVGERLPLVWFLVLFPPVVLVAFIYLVAKHHTKLYAPADFRNEDNFVSVLGTDARRRKMEREIESEEPPPAAKPREPRPHVGGTDSERPAVSGSVPAPLGGATRYFIAEELVLRSLEAEWQVPIRREVRVGDVAVDGVAFRKDGVAVAIEVKAPRYESLAERSVLRAAEHAEAAVAAFQRPRATARFVIAVVLPDTEHPDAVASRLNQLLRDRGLSSAIECRVFSMKALAGELGLSAPMVLSA